MATTIDLLSELNGLNGKKYPDIGYLYWADVYGSEQHNPRIWVIINQGGGVTLSDLNGKTPRERLDKILAAIATIKQSKGL